LYFKKKDTANRKILLNLLENSNDLMEAVPQEQHEHWMGRIEKVLGATENKNIPRSENAGTVVDGNLVMHNGIKVDPLSYYSFPLLKMLMENRGVHEPEEEKIFHEVLKNLNPEGDKIMLELGSYWSFYSMWFLSLFPEAKTFMAELDRKNLLYGKRNFEINQRKGKFIYAGIGNKHSPQSNITTVDEICLRQKIPFLDILHSDIQGYELQMLEGSTAMLSGDKIGYIFISTHSNELHQQCLDFLINYNFAEVANVDLDQSSSWDGILVMKSTNYEGISKVN
ncbi:FkbM family methyltransferase, partial [Ochromonadaceae sp. CCMP2298]